MINVAPLLSFLSDIFGRYSSRIVGIFVATYVGIITYPELAWQFIALAAVTMVGYIAAKRWGINGAKPTRTPVRVQPVKWEGKITDEHLAGDKERVS